MKTVLLFIFCFSFCTAFANYAVSLPASDTVPPPLSHKLNKEAFLACYGKDDSARALIQVYFHRRKGGIPFLAIGSPVTVASGIGLIAAQSQLKKDNKDGTLDHQLGDSIASGIMGVFLGLGAAFVLIGLPRMHRYSRKRLLRALTDYYAGKPIPHGIAKNRHFKSYIQHTK